jgi:hypothetical protein
MSWVYVRTGFEKSLHKSTRVLTKLRLEMAKKFAVLICTEAARFKAAVAALASFLPFRDMSQYGGTLPLRSNIGGGWVWGF